MLSPRYISIPKTLYPMHRLLYYSTSGPSEDLWYHDLIFRDAVRQVAPLSVFLDTVGLCLGPYGGPRWDGGPIGALGETAFSGMLSLRLRPSLKHVVLSEVPL